MGLTRQYLRYAQCDVFGVIGSNKSNIVFMDIRGVRGKYCAVGACEDVIVWDIRTGDKYLTLKGDKQEVTRIARSPDRTHIAVGYGNGMVCVFDLATGERTVNFSGHKSTVTALSYDKMGLRLVSGGKDTDVIVWDIVNECGLFRLKGHKGPVSQVAFLKNKNVVCSSSKDTYVKFWDLDTQHCFKTLVEHRSEVYDFVLLRDDKRLITGSGDSELRVWNISYYEENEDESEGPTGKKPRLDTAYEDEEEAEDLHILKCTKVGSVMRSARDRVVSMVTDQEESALICHGTGRAVEVFKLTSAADLKKRLAKRLKKLKAQLREAGKEDDDVTASLTVQDELYAINSVKTSGKVASVDMVNEGNANMKILYLLNNNQVEGCILSLTDKKQAAENVCQLSMLGHRSDVRTLSFSSDNTAVLSASADSVKVWNRSTLQCIRTMTCDYALCSTFAPGDRHIILGTKSGLLQIFDIASGDCVEEVSAHTGSVWSLCLSPDKRGLLSGSADKQVKFWNFELVSDETDLGGKRLTIELKRMLQMDEDVLCVKYSPDQRLIAVALLDATVKVFFSDTLKFFLSMYGHKLPVLCMDISSDSTLLVTGSADRNIKIWGLDFGDCHKSIFAHDDSVMGVQFVHKTHMFFSCGKDKKVKEWDADKFEHIITLEGHFAEVWTLAVSPSGNFMVSSSHDKSLRVWERTQEPIILEEEKEMEREKEYEESIAQEGESVVAGEKDTETGLAGKKTIETVKAAERLMEALELYKGEQEKLDIHQLECEAKGRKLPLPDPHPLMLAYRVTSPLKYMLLELKKIRSSELEEALLVLPFSYVTDLLTVLDQFITRAWEVELSCRCLLFLLRIHHGQITSNQVLLPVIDRLRKVTLEKVNKLRDTIGFNMAGLTFMQQEIEQSEETMFFMDATAKFKEDKKKKKKKAILAIKT